MTYAVRFVVHATGPLLGFPDLASYFPSLVLSSNKTLEKQQLKKREAIEMSHECSGTIFGSDDSS